MNTYLTTRHNKLRSFIRDDEFVVVVPGENLRYLVGLTPRKSERLLAYAIGSEGDSFLLCPDFERGNLERAHVEGEIVSWQDSEDPFVMCASLLKKAKGKRRLALDPSMEFWAFERLRRELDGWSFFDCGEFFESLRAVKDEDEARKIRQAAEIAENALEKTLPLLREGMTELDVVSEFTYHMKGDGPEVLAQFGANSAIPHHEADETPLRNGDVVLLDFGCRVGGYYSDVTRTFVFGKASEEFWTIREIVSEAQQRAMKKAGAGTPCESVDLEARRFITSKGYGEFFMHRLGHGLGLDIHEAPYLVQGEQRPLVEGNVVTIEPGIYLPGRFGIRMEEDVIVEREGCSLLTAGVQSKIEL